MLAPAIAQAASAQAETLYVSNERGNSVSVIDAASAKVVATWAVGGRPRGITVRSEEHTSELQSLMRISYAVFCLKKKNTTTRQKSIRNKRAHIRHYN